MTLPPTSPPSPAAPDDDRRPLRLRMASVNLFPAERRIVEQLLAIPGYELGAMTSSDLSERSGASRSSIDRLSRKLGYQGLKDMRRALLREEAQRGSPASPADGRRSAGDVARRVMASIAARAEAMAQSLARGPDLDRLLEWLTTARSIQLFGAGESAAACTAVYMRLIRLGLPIGFADEHHTQVTLASLMGPADLAVAISYSGGTKSTMWAAKTAKRNGARLVVITGIVGSPLARLADLLVPLPTGPLPGSAEVVDRVIAVGLAEVLFQCLVADAPDLAAQSLRVDDIFSDDRL